MTRVLVVDDNDENIYYLTALLGGQGYHVDAARHGAEALVIARQTPPDLIVSDLLMPVMDGYTLLRHWKADPRLKSVPFVVYTATYTRAEDEQLAYNLGADAFILKPAEPEDFLARVRHVEVSRANEAPRAPGDDEATVYKTYSETLIRKLEEKTLELEAANRALQEDVAQRMQSEAENRRLLHDLGERVKELGALRKAATILQNDRLPIPELLGRIADLLPPAMQYADLASARVAHGDVDCRTQGFRPDSLLLEARFVTSDGLHGVLQVAYREARPPEESGPFISEEDDLLTSVADMLRLHLERRRAEGALRSSEALLRTAGRVARMGAWALDLSDRTMTWSNEVRAIHEVPPDFVPTVEQAIAFYAPDDRETIRRALNACVLAGTPFDLELQIVTDRGRPVWVRTIGEAVRDDDGRITRLQGAFQDLTERRLAEAEARQIADQLTRTLETMTDAFMTIDREWRYTFVNREAERQLRRSRESLVGRRIWDELPEFSDAPFGAALRRAMDSREPASVEAYVPALDGWFNLRVHPSDQGLAVYFQNVTGERRAREELRASEERFRLLSKATNDAIWDWDLRTNELWWNEGFETLFGYRREEVATTIDSWTSYVHADDRGVIEDVHRAIDGGQDTWSGEYRFRCKDGSYAYVLDRGHIIRNEAGVAVRMIGGMTDLTERRKLEARFLRAQRMESIGTLAGGIAHDLNNVLAPIMMSVGLLQADERDPDRLSMLDSIERSARRGADMVRQVLAFARGVEGRPAPINLVHMARDVEKIVKDTFPKNIAFVLDAPHEPWTVHADATQVHQVIMNLCVNARDAMPRGGTLTVRVENRTLDALHAEMTPGLGPGAYVVVAVTDTGVGIPADIQDRIFEPFFTTKDVGAGTGLGLSTVLSIVKSHHGLVTLYSEPGRGTTFRVYLPATGHEAGAYEAGTPAALPRGDDELILVIDDEESIRMLVQKTLERHGYRVLMASNGADAVALYAQHQRRIAAVITDMAMPVMDGPATITALKALDPDVKIIASSGFVAGDARVLGTGVRHFIAKPYTTEAVLRGLREVIHGTP